MSELQQKSNNASRRQARTRARLHGTTERPRLSVTITNKHVSAQLIDDEKRVTIAAATTVGSKVTGTMTEKATKIGADIAKKAKAKKVTKVVFDRGAKQYHGRIKALADEARKEGMEF